VVFQSQIVNYIMVKTTCISIGWCLLCTRHVYSWTVCRSTL